jgi:hypothetical protein
MSRRPATGEYSEFEWGKYDKTRKAQWTPSSFSVINPILANPDAMSVARDYPNLTRAYFEAVGATVKADDPIRPQEQRKAVYEFNYFMSERREERQKQDNDRPNAFLDWNQSGEEEE